LFFICFFFISVYVLFYFYSLPLHNLPTPSLSSIRDFINNNQKQTDFINIPKQCNNSNDRSQKIYKKYFEKKLIPSRAPFQNLQKLKPIQSNTTDFFFQNQKYFKVKNLEILVGLTLVFICTKLNLETILSL
jgi:hypothetical protein